jgi:transcriptional regulator with XRE-family HTH domain
MSFSGERLRELRQAKGMDRGQLAELAGTTRQYISHLENGVRGNPAYDLVEKLASALGATCLDFHVDAPLNDPPAVAPAPAKAKKGKSKK